MLIKSLSPFPAITIVDVGNVEAKSVDTQKNEGPFAYWSTWGRWRLELCPPVLGATQWFLGVWVDNDPENEYQSDFVDIDGIDLADFPMSPTMEDVEAFFQKAWAAFIRGVNQA